MLRDGALGYHFQPECRFVGFLQRLPLEQPQLVLAAILLVSIGWTLITVRILENMTELSLGPAAAFSVFVIVIVMVVTTCVNALLRRLPAAAAEQAQWGVGGG